MFFSLILENSAGDQIDMTAFLLRLLLTGRNTVEN